MSLKSFLPAAAALAVATVALTGCTQTANVSGGDSSAPAASSTPEASSNPRTDTKTDSSTDSGKSDAAGAFTVNESNAHVEIPAGTKTVVVNGSNNHIEGEAVSEITINGSQNSVEVKSADKVSFTGSNNAVQYHDAKAPQVGSDPGTNNDVATHCHPTHLRGGTHNACHPSPVYKELRAHLSVRPQLRRESGASLAVSLDDRSGNATAVGQLESLFLCPGANLRVLQALRGVAGVATAAGRTHLATSLNVGLNSLGKFLEMLAAQINFVRRAIKREADSLIGGGAIEVVDNFDNLLRLFHVFIPLEVFGFIL